MSDKNIGSKNVESQPETQQTQKGYEGVTVNELRSSGDVNTTDSAYKSKTAPDAFVDDSPPDKLKKVEAAKSAVKDKTPQEAQKDLNGYCQKLAQTLNEQITNAASRLNVAGMEKHGYRDILDGKLDTVAQTTILKFFKENGAIMHETARKAGHNADAILADSLNQALKKEGGKYGLYISNELDSDLFGPKHVYWYDRGESHQAHDNQSVYLKFKDWNSHTLALISSGDWRQEKKEERERADK